MKKAIQEKKVQLETEKRQLEWELGNIFSSTEEADIALRRKLYKRISELDTQIEGLTIFEEITQGIPSPQEIIGEVDKFASNVIEKGSRFFTGLGAKLSEVSRGSEREEIEPAKTDYDFRKTIELVKTGKQQNAFADLLSFVGDQNPHSESYFETTRHAIDAVDSLIKAGREDLALEVLQKLFC